MDYDQILQQLYVGSYPGCLEDIDGLKQRLGITAVLNLQTDEDTERLGLDWPRLQAHYHALGIAVRWVPVRDFDGEDLCRNLPECVRALSGLLQAGHTVYVHCTLGVGRSPSVVVAYLHWVRRLNLEKAFDEVNRCRPCLPNIEAIQLASGDFLEQAEAGEDQPH